ncbi:MAG: FeoA domain-containing protein [Bacillota bacterium]|nr:FeoA domain-containing protein [Bacillota bacterium]
MNLSQGVRDNSYKIINIEMPENIERRLQTLGITEGSIVELLNIKKNGTLILKVRGSRFAVGGKIASGIKIRRAEGES